MNEIISYNESITAKQNVCYYRDTVLLILVVLTFLAIITK